MENLRITLIQTDIVWEDVTTNLKLHERKLDKMIHPTDLIIFPEMFNTGFAVSNTKLAEKMNGPTMRWMAKNAKKRDVVITGSLMIKEKDKYYNRLIWMRPDGTFEKYDKKHLFGLGDEHQNFTAGTEKLIVEFKGWKICPMICYDLRFPTWCRNNDEYDLYINVANWPQKRATHWQVLNQARAIENQSYVAAVNRVGIDGNNVPHLGNSMLVQPDGEVLFTRPEKESVRTFELQRDILTKTRRMYPFLRDRD